MKDLDTYLLLRGLKNGNLSSLESLYKMYYSKLYRFAKKFDSTTLEPDDFVQQTFIKLWEKRSKLKDDVLFDKQLYVICRNIILNCLKRESRTGARFQQKFFYEEDVAENLNDQNKKLEWLHDRIQKLPPKRRKVFLLHKIENLTYEEIAKSLDISKKTIANHIYLAHNFIKEELRKEEIF